MTEAAASNVRRPRTDESRLFGIMSGIYGGQAFLVALELGLFPLLGEKPRSAADVATKLRLAERSADHLHGEHEPLEHFEEVEFDAAGGCRVQQQRRHHEADAVGEHGDE